jgi:hypothetical protein
MMHIMTLPSSLPSLVILHYAIIYPLRPPAYPLSSEAIGEEQSSRVRSFTSANSTFLAEHGSELSKALEPKAVLEGTRLNCGLPSLPHVGAKESERKTSSTSFTVNPITTALPSGISTLQS